MTRAASAGQESRCRDLSSAARGRPGPTCCPVPSTIELPDGRRLAWSEYGDPAGTPVVHCHGGMSSRLDARRLDEPARAVGARLICPDRAGIGRSGRAPGRRLRDWAADVAVLADHLGLAGFVVTGWSAGGA